MKVQTRKYLTSIIAIIALILLRFFSDINVAGIPIVVVIVFTAGSIWFLKIINKGNSKKEYVNLGSGLKWFNEYRESNAQTLGQFFKLNDQNVDKIQAKVSRPGFYMTSNGKRWAIIAKYIDKNKKEHTFYCPELEYDPIHELNKGDSISVYVEKDNYSKYNMRLS